MKRDIKQSRLEKIVFTILFIIFFAGIFLIWSCNQDDSPARKAQDEYDRLQKEFNKQIEENEK